MWFLHVERNKDQKKKEKTTRTCIFHKDYYYCQFLNKKIDQNGNMYIYNNLIICVYIDDEFGEIEYSNHMLMTWIWYKFKILQIFKQSISIISFYKHKKIGMNCGQKMVYRKLTIAT
jgi:hypothetical protein